MTRQKSGFTIVELMIAVVIIAILSAVAVVMYTKIQGDARDSQRATRVSIIAGALEKYYGKNGEYPSCADMTQAGPTVSSNVLIGIDTKALLVPNSAAGVTNSITCTALTTGSADAYAYIGCTTACTSFTLQYKREVANEIVSVASVH